MTLSRFAGSRSIVDHGSICCQPLQQSGINFRLKIDCTISMKSFSLDFIFILISGYSKERRAG